MSPRKIMKDQSKLTRKVVGILSVYLHVLAHAAPMSTEGQFSVSESGAATYTIPLQLPPGSGGIQPQLALSYNSQSGNGLLGVGWSLSGLFALTRSSAERRVWKEC